jgi:hypothetical protein
MGGSRAIPNFVAYWAAVVRRIPSVIKSWFDSYQALAAWILFLLALLTVYGAVSAGDTDAVNLLLSQTFTPRVVSLTMAVGFLAALLEACRRHYAANAVKTRDAETDKTKLEERVKGLERDEKKYLRELEDQTRELGDKIREIEGLRREIEGFKRELEKALGAHSKHIKTLAEAAIRGRELAAQSSSDQELLVTEREKWRTDVTAYLRENLPQEYLWFTSPPPRPFALGAKRPTEVTFDEFMERLTRILRDLNAAKPEEPAVSSREHTVQAGPLHGPVMDSRSE